MEVFITIITAVSILLIGQLLLRLIVEPIVELKLTLGKISECFLRNQAKISNAKASDEIENEIKTLSSLLLSQQHTIPLYGASSKLLNLSSQKNIISACRNLNGIAHYINPKYPTVPDDFDRPRAVVEKMEELKTLLYIKVDFSD